MVKNTQGGKHKNAARKHINSSKQLTNLRISQDELEKYAQVEKNLGNGMCHVVCEINGKVEKLLCHIRGKFRGRGKRDNTISNGSWILIGLREWELEKKSDKLQNCDLLEVYSDLDKAKLKNTVTNINWSLFILNDNKMSNITEEKTEIEFGNDTSLEIKELLKGNTENNKSLIIDNEEINIDDI